MHNCLRISEIISHVCSDLLDADGDFGPKGLARLARTCRAFRDPALDILWHTLLALEPLIRTLPADLWEIQEREQIFGPIVDEKKIFLSRPMMDSDWTRFHLYARRVRVLELSESASYGYTNKFDPDLLSALHLGASMLPLLPNLRELALGINDAESLMPHLGMLFHPQLMFFAIGLSEANLSLGIATLRHLPTALPGLTSLTAYSFSGDGHLLDVIAVSRIAGAWNGLVDLSVSGLTPQAMATVSTLPYLQTLYLRFLKLPDMQHILKPSFPSLRSLEFSTPFMANSIAFLSLLSPKHPLHTVAIWPEDLVPTFELWRSFFEALSEHCSLPALTHVTLEDKIKRDMQPDGVLADMSMILAPLFPSHRLEFLRVNPPWGFIVDDALARVMAASWPHLRELDFLPNIHRRPGPPTTTQNVCFQSGCETARSAGGLFKSGCQMAKFWAKVCANFRMQDAVRRRSVQNPDARFLEIRLW